MSERPKIGIIVGSTRPVNVGRPLAREIANDVEAAGAEAVMLDLGEIRLPLLNEALPPASGIRTEAHTIDWAERIAALDGVVFLTPEYNHGYPAALKNAIDSLLAEWKELPALLVSYGWSGGALAAAQLTSILEFVGVELVGDSVLLTFDGEDFDEAQRMKDVPAFVARHANEIRSAVELLVEASASKLAAA